MPHIKLPSMTLIFNGTNISWHKYLDHMRGTFTRLQAPYLIEPESSEQDIYRAHLAEMAKLGITDKDMIHNSWSTLLLRLGTFLETTIQHPALSTIRLSDSPLIQIRQLHANYGGDLTRPLQTIFAAYLALTHLSTKSADILIFLTEYKQLLEELHVKQTTIPITLAHYQALHRILQQCRHAPMTQAFKTRYDQLVLTLTEKKIPDEHQWSLFRNMVTTIAAEYDQVSPSTPPPSSTLQSFPITTTARKCLNCKKLHPTRACRQPCHSPRCTTKNQPHARRDCPAHKPSSPTPPQTHQHAGTTHRQQRGHTQSYLSAPSNLQPDQPQEPPQQLPQFPQPHSVPPPYPYPWPYPYPSPYPPPPF